MKSYDWMVKYTPQSAWISRKGVLLWLALFFVELGAALYLSAIFFDNRWGMVLGWFITAVLGGGCHLFYLGNPLRFWRAVSRPQTSWISRGTIFLVLFLIAGSLPLVSDLGAQYGIRIAAGILAFLVVIYGGFVMNYVNALALWNSSLLPLLFLIGGLLGGTEIMVAILLRTDDLVMVQKAEEWVRMLIIGYAMLIIIYLWTITYTTPAGKQSVIEILRGRLAAPFYLGAVFVGILVPLAVVTLSFALGKGLVPQVLLIGGVFCGLIGDLVMRYCILKGALYSPLIPTSAY